MAARDAEDNQTASASLLGAAGRRLSEARWFLAAVAAFIALVVYSTGLTAIEGGVLLRRHRRLDRVHAAGGRASTGSRRPARAGGTDLARDRGEALRRGAARSLHRPRPPRHRPLRQPPGSRGVRNPAWRPAHLPAPRPRSARRLRPGGQGWRAGTGRVRRARADRALVRRLVRTHRRGPAHGQLHRAHPRRPDRTEAESTVSASISSPMPATSSARRSPPWSASSRPSRGRPARTRRRATGSSRSCATRRPA